MEDGDYYYLTKMASLIKFCTKMRNTREEQNYWCARRSANAKYKTCTECPKSPLAPRDAYKKIIIQLRQTKPT